MRGLRHGVLKIRDSKHQGAARCLVGCSLWPPARRIQAGCDSVNKCKFCSSGARGALGHQRYDCAWVMDYPRSQGCVYPEDVRELRPAIRDEG
eukprot:6371014-Pyramimonas_sp.AAC.1